MFTFFESITILTQYSSKSSIHNSSTAFHFDEFSHFNMLHYMSSLRLSEIWIYPIKSLRGIRLKKANVNEKGLEYDRRWMLVDEHGMFITQRKHPQLALFQVHLVNRKITIEYVQNGHSTHYAMDAVTGSSNQVRIWHDTIQATEVDPDVSAWFSDQLNLKCKLVFFPEANSRMVDKAYAIQNDQVSLADGYPFLIIGQSSLEDLNARLNIPITMSRFRPNFVFTGGEPYEEDSWRHFTIGVNRFVGVKNCGRCVLTTVDPTTGKTGEEPLRTLSTYRKRGAKVFFGQNVIAVDHQEVHEGDLITH